MAWFRKKPSKDESGFCSWAIYRCLLCAKEFSDSPVAGSLRWPTKEADPGFPEATKGFAGVPGMKFHLCGGHQIGVALHIGYKEEEVAHEASV